MALDWSDRGNSYSHRQQTPQCEQDDEPGGPAAAGASAADRRNREMSRQARAMSRGAGEISRRASGMSAGELRQGALGLGQPGAAGLQGVFRLADGRGVVTVRGLGELGLQGGDGRVELVDGGFGAGE